jgi:hypothetical protein
VLVLFVASEARTGNPLLPLSLFAVRQFAATNAVTFLLYAALSGALFLTPVQLQRVAGFSPIAAGSALLPLTGIMLLLSSSMGRVATRIGPRVPMTLGPLVAGAGLALLVRVGAHTSYLVDVLPAVLVFALGLSVTVAPLTATALSSAPAHRVGIASAVNNDVARTAGLLAVALLPGLAGITPAAYRDPHLLSLGFHRAVLIAAILCGLAGLLSAILIEGKRERPREPIPRVEEAELRLHCPVLTPNSRS